MSSAALGTIQNIPGGWEFEIGNGCIRRRIQRVDDRLVTVSLVNAESGEEYLDEVHSEFALRLMKGENRHTLTSADFRCVHYSTPKWDDGERLLQILLEAEFEGTKFQVSVFYQALANKNFIRKWIQVHPGCPAGWKVICTTIEDFRTKEGISGAVPYLRYARTYPNHEDNVQSEPHKAQTSNPDKRFKLGDCARVVVANQEKTGGLFFFTEGLLGEETFNRPQGLLMRRKEYADLSEGYTSAPAVIGAYSGPPEIGFKRYTQHLMDNYCVIRDKELPVSWNPWFATKENGTPLGREYTREFLLEFMDYMKEAGYYNILHLDLGWEAEWSMKVDEKKFPNGMEEIIRYAEERGLEMGYWINPFSSIYWKTAAEEKHPEWLVPGEANSRSNAHAICIMTDYYKDAKRRFVELVTKLKAKVIYWDGLDWNIPECKSDQHQHSSREELQVSATKRLAEMCREVHEARPDAIFINFSLPFDNHRLSVIDQEQVSDTFQYPTLQSELIQRQQIYQMTWEHPYKAIWGSWYGIDSTWHGKGGETIKRPLNELIYAEMSMIGNGIAQAGGGFNFKEASPEFMAFLKKLFAFRKRFAKYFDVYQHVLGFPDGESIDGEGHIVDGKGFIMLCNPTDMEQTVNLPLSEIELELQADKEFTISDWSGLKKGKPLGKATTASEFPITLCSLEVKYIGAGIGNG